MGWKSVVVVMALACVQAGATQAVDSQQGNSTSDVQVTVTAEAKPAQPEADLAARQKACLQEKVEAAQQLAQAQTGFKKLLNTVSGTGSQKDSAETAAQVSDAADKVYGPRVTMGDLKGAAAELRISEDDIEACRNP